MSDFDYVSSSPISICELFFPIYSSNFHARAYFGSSVAHCALQLSILSVAWASSIGHASMTLILYEPF